MQHYTMINDSVYSDNTAILSICKSSRRNSKHEEKSENYRKIYYHSRRYQHICLDN